jgi:hypothetical protein
MREGDGRWTFGRKVKGTGSKQRAAHGSSEASAVFLLEPINEQNEQGDSFGGRSYINSHYLKE